MGDEASKKAKDKVKEKEAEKAEESKGGEDKGGNGGGKRSQRTTSNVFAMFKQNQIQEFKEKKKTGGNVLAMFKPNQIQEFKEAFTMMDQDRDGIVNPADLKAIFASLGREPSDKEIKEMLSEAADPEKLNFTAFLTLFGDKMHGTDPENTILNAFKMFDEDKKGFLEEAYVKDLLTLMGDNFNDNEVRQTWKEAPIESGKFDYEKFTILMKRGGDEDMQ